jgi:integrase
VSKWWANHLKHCKVEGRKNMHSFRHTVVTRLTAAGVPQDMREMLVGHASNTVHGQVYVHRDKMPLGMLKEHLEKLDFRPLLKG